MPRTAAIVLFVLAFLAIAACSSSDNKSTPAPTAYPASSSTQAPVTATAAPTSSAAPLDSGEPWVVTGEVSGTALMTDVTCDVVQDNYQVNIAGTLNGKYFAVRPTFPTTINAGVNYGPGSTLVIEVLAGTTVSDQYHWNNGGGVEGSGNLSADTTGSGNMSVTVPPSQNSPGLATEPITVSGFWTCP